MKNHFLLKIAFVFTVTVKWLYILFLKEGAKL
jgi:hypothetical protein